MSLDNGLICTLTCDDGYSHLIVLMTCMDTPTTPGVKFIIKGRDLPPGEKGFHVHEKGNLQNGCASLGSHYNPHNSTHGGLNQRNSHLGDLGNIMIDDDGGCQAKIYSHRLILADLVGRSLVIHSKRDDLGRGGDTESLITGNSGSRLCCGVIGFA